MWLSISLMLGWVFVVATLAWLALRNRLDVFTITLAALSVGVAGYLAWLVLHQATSARRAIWVGVLVVWVVVSVPITWVFGGPYLRFELATIQCGHQPAIATNFAAAHRYSLPGDFDYRPSLFADTYYCTASDAEAAGYRRR